MLHIQVSGLSDNLLAEGDRVNSQLVCYGLVSEVPTLGAWGRSSPVRLIRQNSATDQPVYTATVSFPSDEGKAVVAKGSLPYRLVRLRQATPASVWTIDAVENTYEAPGEAPLRAQQTTAAEWVVTIDHSGQPRSSHFTTTGDQFPFVPVLRAGAGGLLSLTFYGSDPRQVFQAGDSGRINVIAVSLKPETDDSSWCVRQLRQALPVHAAGLDSRRSQPCWTCVVTLDSLHDKTLQVEISLPRSGAQGCTVILPSMLKGGTSDVLPLPVFCTNGKADGSTNWVTLYVQYVLVTPFKAAANERGGLANDLSCIRSLESHERLTTDRLVGHRGLGKTITNDRHNTRHIAKLSENTIPAFAAAYRRGCTMVELDTMLTLDGVPVVFHDPMVQLHAAPRGDDPVRHTAHKPNFLSTSVPVHGLRSDELCRLGLESYSFSGGLCRLKRLLLRHWPRIIQWAREGNTPGPGSPTPGSACAALRQRIDIPNPIPTLADVLRLTPSDLAFNIEVKYPFMPHWDMHMYLQSDRFEVNYFVDRILKTVFACAGRRRIAFSSFDPDVCLALTLKQSRYEVLFLSDTAEREDLKDYRSFYIEGALQFATLQSLAGVSMASSTLAGDDVTIPSRNPLPPGDKGDGVTPIDPKVSELLKSAYCQEPGHPEKCVARYSRSPGADIVAEAHRRSLKVWTWGDPNTDHCFDYVQGVVMKVDAIITDNSLFLQRQEKRE